MSFEEILLTCERGFVAPERVRLVPSRLLAALRRAGTAHVYADTADAEELRRVLTVAGNRIVAEVDGNTVNQPLVRRVLDRYLTGGWLRACAGTLQRQRPEAPREAIVPYLYTLACGWIGRDIVGAFASSRPWEVSLQLHMGAVSNPMTSKVLARALRAMVPSAFVKVPFRPHEPGSLLIARDLEGENIPVNLTSTFSARQVVAAALLGDVTRSNIFMGRLNQGFRAGLLGEHVDLEAQRALRRLRREAAVKTQLILASVREWQTFLRVAGCDVFTAPCSVLAEFLGQSEVSPDAVTGQLETSYEDRLGISADVAPLVGPERIARLWRVEPEFVEFLVAYRASTEYRELRDGEALWRRFEEAGFGDFFYAPNAWEWERLRGDLAKEFVKTHGLRAADVMTAEVVTVTDDTPLPAIAQVLEERRIKRVPVVREGRLVGIVSRADLLRAVAARKTQSELASKPDDRTIRDRDRRATRR